MTNDILYCGDTHLHSAAAYLAGLMTDFGFSFDYIASDQPVATSQLNSPRKLFILSDYPAVMFATDLQEMLIEQVKAGAGLLMLGGWESYYGLGGDWHDTLVASALPVTIGTSDDRVNCDQPTMLQAVQSHEITADLPWNSRPPLIGGYNRLTPKLESTILLNACTHAATYRNNEFHFQLSQSDPLLVIGSFNKGRTAALATDVAPHWVGPLVDWGDLRLATQATNADEVEVGNWYAKFFKQLLTWTGEMK